MTGSAQKEVHGYIHTPPEHLTQVKQKLTVPDKLL